MLGVGNLLEALVTKGMGRQQHGGALRRIQAPAPELDSSVKSSQGLGIVERQVGVVGILEEGVRLRQDQSPF